MNSSFNGILMIVKNRGEPAHGSGKIERKVEEFKSFETRNTEMFGRFLQILEKKL
ncbi:hypothetical protein JEZ13_11595 [bacterium]|nr:hypothetical protein [bacterium]